MQLPASYVLAAGLRDAMQCNVCSADARRRVAGGGRWVPRCGRCTWTSCAWGGSHGHVPCKELLRGHARHGGMQRKELLRGDAATYIRLGFRVLEF